MDKSALLNVFAQINQPAPPIVLYDDITRFKPCIFLYRGHKMGHWCAILGHSDSWEIFDPQGCFPDTELLHPAIVKLPPKFRNIAESQPFRVYYNHMKLQKGGKSCGLWCVFRFIHHKLDYDQFIAKFGTMTDLDVCNYFGRLDLLN